MSSHPRTSQGLPQLDPARQMLLIWDALCAYVTEILEAGKSINIRNFGAFTFEPIVESGGHSKNPRGDKLQYRPCFLCAPELRASLYRYPGKEELYNQHGSVYQQGCQMSFLNCVPIAAGTYLKEAVIRSTITALFTAIVDLSTRGYNLELDFKFAKVRVKNRDLEVYYSRNFTNKAQDMAAQWPKRQDKPPLSETWVKKNLSKAMMEFHPRPESADKMRQKTRTAQLGILSLDLNSCTNDRPKIMTVR
jgi:nucleoid DNA-binding protein